jgi:hypothetical protein
MMGTLRMLALQLNNGAMVNATTLTGPGLAGISWLALVGMPWSKRLVGDWLRSELSLELSGFVHALERRSRETAARCRPVVGRPSL